MVDGEPYDRQREQSQAHDVRVLPEEPLRNGCVPPMTVVDNLNLRSFDLGPRKSRRRWLDRAGMATTGAGDDRGLRHPHALPPGADRRAVRRQRAALRAGARTGRRRCGC